MLQVKQLIKAWNGTFLPQVANAPSQVEFQGSEIVAESGCDLGTNFKFTAKGSKGETYEVLVDLTKINGEHTQDSEIRVRCSCQRYRFLYASANKFAGASCGAEFPAYEKKTDRPPLNPEKKPGICKHVASSLFLLVKLNRLSLNLK